MVAPYIHAGGKIGVLVEVQCAEPGEAAFAVAKDLCMQVAAASPRFVTRDEVTPEVLESEKEIYKAQVLAQGKPANIVDKIVEGKMNKFYEENCLVEQAFVKNLDQSVTAYIQGTVGKDFQVKRFIRFILGAA